MDCWTSTQSNMSNSISYSDFLKEGALKEEKKLQQLKQSEVKKPFRIVPQDIATDAEERDFWKRLRHFFRTGERPPSKNGVYVPALIAPYLRNGNWDTEYPFYLAQESSTSQPLATLIQTTFDELFTDKEAKVLRRYLPKLNTYFNEQLINSHVAFQEVKDKAFKKMRKIEVHDDEGERYLADLEKFESSLPLKGHVLTYHYETPLLLIRQKLQQIEWNRKQFKQVLKSNAEALKEKLHIDAEKEGSETPEKGFEFASEMIALQKVQEMQPDHGSKSLSPQRRENIKGIIKALEEVITQDEKHAHIVVTSELSEAYDWENLFESSVVSIHAGLRVFTEVDKVFDQNIGQFMQALIALRKAKLELDDKYEPEVHDDYFNHFKWFKLDQEELNIFPPVIMFTTSNNLLHEGMSPFSKLLVKNKPIKVVALVDRTVNPTNPNIDWEDASLSFRQELAANALAHRNVHTLQCAADRPNGLLMGVRSSMESIAPSVMHLLVPTSNEDLNISFLKVNAAAAGRYFPYILYDPNKGTQWGGRFDVADNSQAEKDWPVYPFVHQSPDDNEMEMDLAFTYADYKAMTPEKVEELFLVPESMVNDYLVPIADYLSMGQDEQTGKVPYIWLVDEDNQMVRAAVPYMWVASCQERLEFWNFIQEIGGLNNYHVKASLEEARERWDADKLKELQALEAKHQEALLVAQRESAGVAMEKLASVLLDMDQFSTVSKPKAPQAKKAEEAIEEMDTEEISEEVAVKDEEEATEAWIETYRCTSCNDCTDKYPGIFAYNEEKQAYVKDASKGTFEQIVMAAENCPAACIHPGQPLDPTEANLQELKERAAKFN